MAKLSYMTNLGNVLDNPNTPQKSYWKLINRVMSIGRAPKIPPLIVNNLFVINCKEKAIYFNEFVSEQCKTIVNSSVLPVLNFHTEKRIGVKQQDPTVYLVKCYVYVMTLSSYHLI